MAKLKGKELKPLYAAGEQFVQRVLETRDSMFTPGKAVWTQDVVDDLYDRFIGHPDTSDKSFEQKFQQQLAGAPPTIYQLAGELLYVHLLAGNSSSGEHKRNVINTVLRWSPDAVSIPPELDAALDEGFAAAGMGYNIYRPFLLQYLLEFVRKWWTLSDQERSLALSDPWAFKEVAVAVEVPASHSQRESLLHLVHTDKFEPIMSRDHKRKIAAAFASLAGNGSADKDVDKQLLKIREKLTEREGRDINFYEPKFLVSWQPGADPWAEFVKFAGLFYRLPGFDEEERNYKLRLAEKAGPAVAKLSNLDDKSPEEFRKVMRSKDQNIVRWQNFEPFVVWYHEKLPLSHMAVTRIRDESLPISQRIRGLLDHVPKDVVSSPAARTTLASFFLFASDPLNMIVFRARPFEWAFEQVDYPPPPDEADEAQRYEHALAFTDRLMNECAQRGLKLRDRLDGQSLVWAMAKYDTRPEGMKQEAWDEFTQYRGGKPVVPEDEEENDGNVKVSTSKNNPALEVVPLENDPIGKLLILGRRNVVLYGPPGTGKTHASLQLAEKWRRRFGSGSVFQVTFHPTFAYEDFIEGFRPNADGRFELRKGLFVDACERAHADAGRQFLLVIDELNRGDVARLFGELITLIEADKRHAGVNRTLPYSQRELWVPPNLHLLGTMNTADRSISLLDIAIRRRFCFVEYRPDPLVIGNSRVHHHAVDGLSLGGLMESINRRLHGIGIDRDRAVGHSHFLVAASETKPLEVLRDRFRYDIVPLVEEYCYADRSLLRRVFEDLVTEEGVADEDVIGDDAELLKVLLRIASGNGRDAVDVEPTA